MATSNQRGRLWYSIAIVIMVVLAGAITFAYAGSQRVAGQADLTLDSLNVSGVNRTINSSVRDIVVDATLDWRYDVPDASRRFVKLKAGPDEGNLTTIQWAYSDVSVGQDSGTTTLTGSLLDATGLNISDFDPDIGNTTTNEVIIAAVFEVERSAGDTVTARVTQPVTITLTDEETLRVSVGGSAEVSVLTDTPN